MDRRLYQCYEEELKFIRSMGVEFAHAFPKIAGRLDLGREECADPYVERLLEGFAFMAARVQLKLKEEFPKFCQQILSMVYPDYLAPLPSMTVVQLIPDRNDSSTVDGFRLERGLTLRSGLGIDMQTRCEFRTAHEVNLYPLVVSEAEYLASRAALSRLGIRSEREVSAGVRIEVNTTCGVELTELQMDELPLFIGGSGHIPTWLYEHLLTDVCDVSILTGSGDDMRVTTLGRAALERMGFAREEAMLNYRARSFEGYRLIREFFAFPERYRFIRLKGLGQALREAKGDSFQLIIHLRGRMNRLENVVDESNFLPFCTPAVNIFPRRADRIHIDDRTHELHVVPDRSRPMDYEVYQILGVTGYGSHADDRQEFKPFYGVGGNLPTVEQEAYYTVQRQPRVLSSRQRERGKRSSYLGQEVFISLVDGAEAPYRSDLTQLGVHTLCTNRDLPNLMPRGQPDGDFTLEVNAPVEKILCVAGPTRPGPPSTGSGPGQATMTGDYAWRVISHLSLNYLSLVDQDDGAAALREILELYSNYNPLAERQIKGVLNIEARPVTRRLPIAGPISFGRGLEITLTLEESAFEAGGMVLFGSVLDEFFSKYVSINNLIETVLRSDQGIEIARWPVRMGLRPEL